MGTPVMIYGPSGSGKSASLRQFGKEAGVINVLGKPMPFRLVNFPVFQTDDYEKITSVLTAAKSDSIVIDDAGYLLVNMFMRGHAKQGAGGQIFNFYNQLADRFWSLIEHIKKLHDQKIVYLIMHDEQTEFGRIKPKTIGRLLDEKVCIEGLFSIVLRSERDDQGYWFLTNTNGLDCAKSPIGMFHSAKISNDLKMVDQTIREYYGLKGEKSNG